MTPGAIAIGRQNYASALAMLVLAALAVGLMPSATKIALNDGANPQTVLMIRSVIGIAVFGSFLLMRGGSFRVPRPVLLLLITAGVSSALMNFSFATAITTLDVSLAILILFTHPFLVVFYYHWTRGEAVTPQRLAWSLVAFAGLGLALAVDLALLDGRGLAFAAVAALLCTCLVVSMVQANRQIGGLTVCFYVSLCAFIMFSSAAGLTGSFSWPRSGIGWSAAFATGLAFAVAYFCFLYAAKLIGASRASLLSFMEPLVTILFAAYMLGESLTLPQWIGVALVAAGLLLLESYPGKPKHA